LTGIRWRGTVSCSPMGRTVMLSYVRALWCVAVVGVALLGADRTSAATLLEKNFWLGGPDYDGVLPACNHPEALARIASRFATKERRFWNSSLQIVGIDHVRETAFRPWDRDLIPRRFCVGRAYISDGKVRPVYYWIGEDTGMIGASWGIEWCVVGYDRNWAYNPSCKMAQP
jgi:hypothetical protein